ncbi:MAG TPA: response regulator transcription factor [Desulfuromonadaceae bacterium]|nr:response regulator transcription factor [Desulfuromonadaceae bacterium]
MPITVSIVEDDRDTRDALAIRVSRAEGLRILNTYPSAEAALEKLITEKPDVLLVDINLPGMSGIECVGKLKSLMPDLPMLMITTYEETELIFNSLRAGAKGYLLKNTPPAELIQAIEQVHAGGAPMSMQIARKVVDYFCKIPQPAGETDQLSNREEEVLALLAKGLLYKEIGDKLGISMNTVRTHVHRIYEKLHVQSRTEAAIKFLER